MIPANRRLLLYVAHQLPYVNEMTESIRQAISAYLSSSNIVAS